MKASSANYPLNYTFNEDNSVSKIKCILLFNVTVPPLQCGYPLDYIIIAAKHLEIDKYTYRLQYRDNYTGRVTMSFNDDHCTLIESHSSSIGH